VDLYIPKKQLKGQIGFKDVDRPNRVVDLQNHTLAAIEMVFADVIGSFLERSQKKKLPA
jgi:hypothetical protein